MNVHCLWSVTCIQFSNWSTAGSWLLKLPQQTLQPWCWSTEGLINLFQRVHAHYKEETFIKDLLFKRIYKIIIVNKCFFQITFTIFFKSLFVRFLLFESMRYSDITHNISCFPEYLRIVCMYKCYYLGRSEFFFPFKPFIFNLNFPCIQMWYYIWSYNM